MDTVINNIFANSAHLILTGCLAAALFFGLRGVREVSRGCLDGMLGLALSVFFICAHVYCLLSLPADCPLAGATGEMTVLTWLVILFAPALIGLYLIGGIVDLLANHTRAGAVRVFFGLTLFCFMHMVGVHWPLDAKVAVILVYVPVWFDVELEAVR